GTNAQLMGRLVNGEVVLRGELAIGDGGANALAEHFSAATRHRVEPRLTQRDEHVTHRHLVDARDMRDFDRCQRLDMDMWVALLERANHRYVVLKAALH